MFPPRCPAKQVCTPRQLGTHAAMGGIAVLALGTGIGIVGLIVIIIIVILVLRIL
jgi:hypothetical protein